MFTHDLTIVNKKFNTSTKLEEYKTKGIKGFWSSRKGITIGDTQIRSSDGVIVRILKSESGYVAPATYQALTTVTTQWTLQNDDYIVKGIVTGAVTSIATLKATYPECRKITNIEVKDYSSTGMQHFAISGE